MSVDMVGLACAEGPSDNVWWMSVTGTDGMEILRLRLNDTGPTVRFAAPDTTVRDLACDGERVWAACADGTLYGMSASGVVEQTLGGLVPDAWGLTWDGEHLWASSLSGKVFEVDPSLASTKGSLEAGTRREFPGTYTHLAFANGYLWGLDKQMKRVCQIQIEHDK